MTDLFTRTDSWVFDLDNTLYDAESHVFVECGNRMTDFVSRHLKVPDDEAARLRKHYYHTYGTTLRGLMSEHGVDPAAFLEHVHDIDISVVPPCAVTQEYLALLPGKRFVFTNAPRAFAEDMLAQLGIRQLFEGVFAIEDAAYWPKPKIDSYHVFLNKHGIDPKRACMFEDLEVNLRPAHALGMSTVWFHGKDVKPEDLNHPHTHHKAEKLPDWLLANVTKP